MTGAEGSGRVPAQRFVALDSMRGIAACIVVLFHLYGGGWITGSTFISNGFLFVDFFFVLSGFVIAASYGQRLAEGFPVRSFVWLRFWRLYPLHLAMLLAFVIIVGLREAQWLPVDARIWEMGTTTPAQLLRAALLIENFAPQDSGWNGPSWSIEVEFWAYMIAAGAFAILQRRAVLFFMALVLLAGGLTALFHLGIRFTPLGFNAYTLLRCLFAFSIGVLGWEAHRRYTGALPLSRSVATAMEIASVGMVLTALSLVPALPLRMGGPFLFLAVLLVLAREMGVVSSLLLRPVPVMLGTLSYSIYMTHAAVLITISMAADRVGLFDASAAWVFGSRGTVPDGPIADLCAFAMLGAVILFSWLTYRWIERPAREWSRKRVASREARRAEAIAPTF